MERFRKADRLLKVKKSGNGLRGILYKFEWDTSVSPNKCHLVKMESASFNTTDVEVVKRQFGMIDSKPVTSDNYIDVNHRVIWTNNDYAEWEECMLADYPDEASREAEGIEISYERYMEDMDNDLYDERANLDIPVNGVIVCFADLGLWDGHHQGAKKFGKYVKNILHSSNDYQDWYCDRYNVRCTDVHHDGTNTYLYRVAKDEEQADRLVQAIAYEDMTEEEFRKATRSLRPYVAKVYGW
jgi:hypothetical protein